MTLFNSSGLSEAIFSAIQARFSEKSCSAVHLHWGQLQVHEAAILRVLLTRYQAFLHQDIHRLADRRRLICFTVASSLTEVMPLRMWRRIWNCSTLISKSSEAMQRT